MIITYQSTLNCPYIKQECNGEGSSFECMVYLVTNNKNDKKCEKLVSLIAPRALRNFEIVKNNVRFVISVLDNIKTEGVRIEIVKKCTFEVTLMPILLLQERVTKAMENGKIAVAIYIDLQKAFDTVNHNILIGKCEKYGISGSALNLLKSYLTNRKQCVEYQEVRSALEDVTLGVPQGSILGPLLFLLYINDLPNACANSECLLYADDTAIIFESKNIVELQQTINDELRTLNKWLQSNQLSLNTKKTVYQLYSQTRSQISLDLKVNNDTIQLVEKVKYLGVMIDPCLNWKYHIDGITAIISRNIGVINRAKFYLDKHCLTLLYNSLVLPYINYCCLIWGFTFPSYLLKIELLQKRAIRILDNQHRIAHTAPIFRELKILKVGDIPKQQLMVLMHRKYTYFVYSGTFRAIIHYH